jgi:hypothetical protein
MANSGTVTAGSAALASQYNNLRDDVLNITTGHTHTGASEDGKKVEGTAIASTGVASNYVLTANGSNAVTWAALSSGGILKYEEFTSSGSFVIPANASSSAILLLNVIGAGAGGNSGARYDTSTAGAGGAGGAGGGVGDFVFLASTFGTAGGTVTVTIGAGGAGGASKTTAGNGNLGSAGGTTSFGSVSFAGAGVTSGDWQTTRSQFPYDNSFIIIQRDNNFDSIKNSPSGSALPSGANSVKKITNDQMSSVQFSIAGHGVQEGYGSAWDTVRIPGGGAGGGGITAAGVFKRGGNGAKVYNSPTEIMRGDNGYEPYYTYGNGSSGGTVAGAAGSASPAGSLDGAGGGASSSAGSAGSGGNGAIGGGGGGGGASHSQNSGKGGTGGSGRIRVWVIG